MWLERLDVGNRKTNLQWSPVNKDTEVAIKKSVLNK